MGWRAPSRGCQGMQGDDANRHPGLDPGPISGRCSGAQFQRKPWEADAGSCRYLALMTYKISGLDPAQFAHLIGLSDEQLATHGAARMIANGQPSFPCRIQLDDA